MPSLQSSFERGWRDIGATSNTTRVFEALVTAYAEPHRKYHSVQHLSECLEMFESVRGLAKRPAEVEVALWFHDAVYEVKLHDNEEQSANWARHELESAKVEAEVIERVFELVMATRHTSIPAEGDQQLLVDIDLSILGANTDRFAQYEKQIREEYAFVPGWIFRSKRKSILKSFLDRQRIYSTEHFHAELEQRARQNLTRAIST